jgi:hypothetical protein
MPREKFIMVGTTAPDTVPFTGSLGFRLVLELIKPAEPLKLQSAPRSVTKMKKGWRRDNST